MLTNSKLVAEFEFRSLLANIPALVRSLLVEPVAYLFLLGAGLQGLMPTVTYLGLDLSYLTFAFPGIIAIQLLRSFSNSVYRLTVDRRWGLQALKMVSGTSSGGYLAGMYCLPVVLFLCQLLVSLPFAYLLGVQLSALGIVLLALVGVAAVIFWTSLAMAITFFIRSYSVRDMWLAFLIMPLTFAAPVFYSLERAPYYLQVIARVNPLAYQVIAMRDAFALTTLSASFWWSLIAAIILAGLARIIMARAEYIPTER